MQISEVIVTVMNETIKNDDAGFMYTDNGAYYPLIRKIQIMIMMQMLL